MSVTDPGAHNTHADVDAELYCPATHAVQFTAPEPRRTSVTEPAAHAAHADVATALYCPATHAVQRTAPVPVSVSVTEPPAHAKQVGWAALPWYCPAAQSAHATVEAGLYCPATHAVQLVAPPDASAPVTNPTGHGRHGDVDTAV